jgi:hypothetical protein
VNLEEARKLARDAHIWAAYEWKAPDFTNTPEVKRVEDLASAVLLLADEVERLRKHHKCERFYANFHDGMPCVVCGKQFGEES